jgi:hypothetical protein
MQNKDTYLLFDVGDVHLEQARKDSAPFEAQLVLSTGLDDSCSFCHEEHRIVPFVAASFTGDVFWLRKTCCLTRGCSNALGKNRMRKSQERSAGAKAPQTYYRDKRDLLQRQKRPTTETKETYYSQEKSVGTKAPQKSIRGREKRH